MPYTVPEPREWLTAYARVQSVTDREILRVLRDANADITRMLREMASRPGIGAAVRREQLQTVKRNLLREQAVIFRRIGDIITARRLEAASRVVALEMRIAGVLLTGAGRSDLIDPLREGLLRGLERTVEVAVTRMTQSRFPLAERIYKTRLWMDGRVERMVNSALVRGLSVREFAAEARDFFAHNTPGGVRYASLRLARSEINNAYHAIAVNHAAEAPWVEGVRWYLSGSHPKPDICDDLANRDLGLGPGVYRPRDVPRKPHPQCFCYVTPIVVDEDRFLDSLIAGRYDDYIRRTTGI